MISFRNQVAVMAPAPLLDARREAQAKVNFEARSRAAEARFEREMHCIRAAYAAERTWAQR